MWVSLSSPGLGALPMGEGQVLLDTVPSSCWVCPGGGPAWLPVLQNYKPPQPTSSLPMAELSLPPL